MSHVFTSIIKNKDKALRVGYVSGKGFNRFSTTSAMLANFFVRYVLLCESRGSWKDGPVVGEGLRNMYK